MEGGECGALAGTPEKSQEFVAGLKVWVVMRGNEFPLFCGFETQAVEFRKSCLSLEHWATLHEGRGMEMGYCSRAVTPGHQVPHQDCSTDISSLQVAGQLPVCLALIHHGLAKMYGCRYNNMQESTVKRLV